MAVNLKSMNGLAALKKLGLPEALGAWLMDHSVEVALSSTQFVFTHPKLGSSSITVTLNQLQTLSAGTLPSATKMILCNKAVGVIKAMQNVQAGVDPGSTGTGALENPPEPYSKYGVLSKLPHSPPSLQPAAPKPAAVASKWAVFPPAAMHDAQMVKLREATMLYQPVFGTSQDSRYFVVAANDDLRVAARYEEGTLSLRIEGPKFSTAKNTVLKAGFKHDAGKEHASLHLKTGSDKTLTAKTLGAVLLGLGIEFVTPLPQLKVIAS